ncbi:MAG: FtsX-like permease family protein [Chloroflexi bacterium]|nr:FtsX-like permease family protein [Chloroflexota bacterium]
MNELFGLSMTYIAAGCLAATTAILGFVALIAIRNPVMFKTGLRNIPRRPAQTSLIVIGLMLSTLITSAAFGTGDTLTKSITSEVYNTLGEADEIIQWDTEKRAAAVDQQLIPMPEVESWRREFAGDPDIEAFAPFISERFSVQDVDTRLNEFSARIVAYRPEDAAALGGIKDLKGRPVELSANEIAVNKELASEIDAEVGHTLVVLFEGNPVELRVKAIVPNNVLSGTFETSQRQGGVVSFAFLSDLTGKGNNADGVFVTNRGGVKSGMKRSDAAVAKLEPVLDPTAYKIEPFKQDGIQMAEMFGSIFTTVFIVFGLFSIAAGVLLIFLIFVMLAAERKPEMGMARAVGAKRSQLVESFLAEGMGYDLGAAVVGLFAGMGVTWAMMRILDASAGQDLGLNLNVAFTPRSLITAFSLGVIATFIVIFISSWRASRLNIVSAIRDLPESHPPNPEDATLTGYIRATLNGVMVMGVPLGASLFFFGPVGFLAGVPLVLIGLISPWFYVLRGSNFAGPRDHRTGEGPPRWPWITGLAVPVIGSALILPWYFIALFLVWLTRDRKPRRVPGWLPVAGIVIPPLGFALTLLQDARARVNWPAGTGAALGLTGVALVYGGLQHNGQFFFAFGISLVVFWVAVSLYYYRVNARMSFTLTSVALLAFWYLAPSGKLEWLTGELNGDIEMFFLSGLVMVACGTFIVVYNADIVLPLVAALGSRFGRIVPALKTGVAYPLTSRFRTGMTMAMIGLIMFALVVNATLNSNFAAIFLNDDTLGGFDTQLEVNPNNPIDDITAAVASTAADPAQVVATGENRFAYPFEAEVENRDRKKNDEREVKDFSRYTFIGADDAFIAAVRLPLKFRAAGYATDRAVWDALAGGSGFAILNAGATVAPQAFGPPVEAGLLYLDPLEAGFEPFTLKLRDPGTGRETTITVIGQAKEAGETFWPGIFVSKDTLLAAFPASRGQTFYFTLKPGADAEAFAKQLESGLVQASGESLRKLLDDQQATQNAFMLVFQGFMGLGLIVGIAALAVVASRAVVERRQQIGMLRAIGYQRSMVALSFLFESGFIAVSGILLGLSLGLSLAWVLFTSGALGEESKSFGFAVPWAELFVISTIAFASSMLMTFLPARSASRVPVAEALRYE